VIKTRVYKKLPYRENRNRQLLCRYGITAAQYDTMLAAQNGVCFICKQPPKRQPLYVDHNHKTGEVRKLLCAGCNSAVGHIDKDDNFMWKAIMYAGGLYDLCG
jgi:hypothetical protein